MSELPASGNDLTWGGMRGNLWIQSRLERAFGNKSWFRLFHVSNQVFLDKRGSDHRPVLVKLVSSSEAYKGSFRFDSRFLNKPVVKEEIKKAWLTNHPFFNISVADKLKKVRKTLSKWKKTQNLNARDNIVQIKKEFEKVHSDPFPSMNRSAFLRRELIKAYKEEEMFWRQKSKEKWAVKGDRNTKFYHASVKANRAKNRINKLVDANGMPQWSEAAKGEVAVEYFSTLFTSNCNEDYSAFFSGFSARVTTSMNDQLIRPVSKAEVKEAVYAIKAASAPGPDGMTGLFFQKY
ncbi:hypothetical protein N665_0806s0004 [Sinapis alba]|nr:hypothetical protein N665_0806s0004 [Sinapis alba]